MIYEINRTDDNKIPIKVDNSRTKKQIGLTWVGQYYSRYGETLHENFLRLAENFAGPETPGNFDDQGHQFNHVLGQLWYDTNDDDHFNNKILRVFDDNTEENTDGFKRIEVILSPSEPQYHTEGELWYHTQDRLISISRGNNWEDLTVRFAMDSDLLDGLDSTQFLRSDVDDVMEGELEARNIFPGNTLSYNLGRSDKRWNLLYSGVLDTNYSLDLIPNETNQYNLGNDSSRWKEIHVERIFTAGFADVNPISDNQYTLGTENLRWHESYINRLNVDQSNTILPFDNSRDLGSNTKRWNNLKLHELDTLSTRNLNPSSDNQYTLGKSSEKWKELYTHLIKDTETESLVPKSHNNYDLGDSNNSYRNLYVRNIVKDTNVQGELKYDIVQNNDSYGITWSGLNDEHRIFVEEYSNASDTRLVLQSGANDNDYLVVKHNNESKLSVKSDIVDATAGTLRTKGKFQVEHENVSSGVEMEYNQVNQSLEFKFY